MVDIEEQLAAYGEGLERALTAGPGPSNSRAADANTRAGRGRSWLVAVAAGVLVVSFTWAALGGSGDREVSTADRSGLFAAQTDAVVVFTGNEDLVAVDVDTGEVVRRRIEGDRPGGHPFWLAAVDGHFVVGVEEIYAAAFDGPSQLIDEATVFLPAAHPEAVWTIDYQGDYPNSPAEARLVTLNGDTMSATPNFDGERYLPLLGVPDGLAVRDRETGLLGIWNPATNDVDAVGPEAFIDNDRNLASNGQLLAWCTDTCAELHVQGLDQTGAPTAPAAGHGLVAIAPDGRRIATQTSSRLTIFEPAPDDDGFERTHQYPIDQVGSIQWTNDSSQLIYTAGPTSSRAPQQVTIGRYDTTSSSWSTTRLDDLDFFAGHSLVLDRNEAAALFTADATIRQDPGSSAEPSSCDGDAIIFLEPEATSTQINTLIDQVRNSTDIAALAFWDQDATYEEFKLVFADEPAIVDSVTPDILPPSIRIRTTDPAAVHDLADTIRDEDGVREVVTRTAPPNTDEPSMPDSGQSLFDSPWHCDTHFPHPPLPE